MDAHRCATFASKSTCMPSAGSSTGIFWQYFFYLYLLFISTQVRDIRIEANKHAISGERPPVPLTSLKPEDGYRMDAIKSDFKSRFGYELDNRRLGEFTSVL